MRRGFGGGGGGGGLVVVGLFLLLFQPLCIILILSLF